MIKCPSCSGRTYEVFNNKKELIYLCCYDCNEHIYPSKYLDFKKVKYEGKKTFNIDVLNKEGITLGIIKWHPGWRRYAFFIASGMFFDSECLKDITNYIDQLMFDRKKVK